MNDAPTLPDPATIERFEAATAGHAVTGLAPLSYDRQKNRVELSNLVRAVTEAVEGFAGEATALALRDRLQAVVGRARPVQRPASLCVFTDGSDLDALLLPECFSACVLEDTRYYVRPLIEAAATHGEFLLLALSQGEVRLYRMSGEDMSRVHLDDLPASLPDVVGHELDGGTLQHHTTSGKMFHGQGKGDDDRDAEVDRFLRAVDQALTDDASTREDYLMIAAVEEIGARFRQLSHHPHLLDEAVTLSPDQTFDDDLRLAACEAFERWRARDNEAFLTNLHEEHHGHAASATDDIVKAAQEGRVDTLVARHGRQLWGRFDPQGWSVELHRERLESSRDLVDEAMRAAWRQGGRIRVLRDEVPGMDTPLEARLRY